MNLTDTLLLLLLVVPIGAIMLWQLWLWLRARRVIGDMAPDTSTVDAGVETPNRLYFFHSIHCGACRAQMPLIEQFSKEFPNLILVDMEKHAQLFKDFGIVGTPTFIHVVHGRIREVRLGGRSESWLRSRLSARV